MAKNKDFWSEVLMVLSLIYWLCFICVFEVYAHIRRGFG